jgi:hypothetical protein
MRCPPIRVHRPGSDGGRLVSTPSGVRSPGAVVRGLAVRAAAVHPSSIQPAAVHPSGVHPSGVQPSGVQPAWCPPPSVRTRPSPPTSGGGVGDQVEAVGTAATGPGRGPGGQLRRRAARSVAEGPDADGACESRVGHRGSVADPGRVCEGGDAWPLRDQAGQAGVRSARRCGCAVGTGAAAARGGRTGHVAAVPSGCATTVRGRRGGCRSGGRARRGRWACRRGWGCGPSAAQAGGERPRLAANRPLTCDDGWWACQDLNLGPHPYQGCALTA